MLVTTVPRPPSPLLRNIPWRQITECRHRRNGGKRIGGETRHLKTFPILEHLCITLHSSCSVPGSRAYTAMVAVTLPSMVRDGCTINACSADNSKPETHFQVRAFTILMLYSFHELSYSTSMTLMFYLVFLLIKLQVADCTLTHVSGYPHDTHANIHAQIPVNDRSDMQTISHTLKWIHILDTGHFGDRRQQVCLCWVMWLDVHMTGAVIVT